MYIVLSQTGTFMLPSVVKWQPGPTLAGAVEVAVPGNGIFQDRATAKVFAEHCAKKWPGHKYYLMGRESTVQTVDPAVKWEDTP